MSDNFTQTPTDAYQITKPKVKWTWWKTTIVAIIGLVSVSLIISSTISYFTEFNPKYKMKLLDHDPPTYTGTEPQLASTFFEAYQSNNDFVIVFMPCSNASLNESTLDLTIKAANRIRNSEKIYVGVFILPENSEILYPQVTLRLFSEQAQFMPVSIRENITDSSIYKNFLERKFWRS
ncbi:MAG: hypothetical protein FWH42_05015 [Dehalococcoidia bacterium]|nr:hypothetical protein [Dehalococcoidia bacterium]